MTTQEELRNFDKVIRLFSSEITLKIDALIMKSSTTELISKELDRLCRELICAAGTLKNLAYDLKKEERELTWK